MNRCKTFILILFLFMLLVIVPTYTFADTGVSGDPDSDQGGESISTNTDCYVSPIEYEYIFYGTVKKPDGTKVTINNKRLFSGQLSYNLQSALDWDVEKFCNNRSDVFSEDTMEVNDERLISLLWTAVGDSLGDYTYSKFKKDFNGFDFTKCKASFNVSINYIGNVYLASSDGSKLKKFNKLNFSENSNGKSEDLTLGDKVINASNKLRLSSTNLAILRSKHFTTYFTFARPQEIETDYVNSFYDYKSLKSGEYDSPINQHDKRKDGDTTKIKITADKLKAKFDNPKYKVKFEGWYTEKYGKGQKLTVNADGSASIPVGNGKYYAHYTAKVTFHDISSASKVTSASGDYIDNKSYYDVTYGPYTVTCSNKISTKVNPLPEAKLKNVFEVFGWYLDTNEDEEVTKDYKVSENIDVYMIYTRKDIEVRFYSFGGSMTKYTNGTYTLQDTLIASSGMSLSAIGVKELPKIKSLGSEAVGVIEGDKWYINNDKNKPFKLDIVINKSLDVYAKYKEPANSVHLTFYEYTNYDDYKKNNYRLRYTYILPKGSSLLSENKGIPAKSNIPGVISKSGWYVDMNLNKVFKRDTVVNADTSVYALYDDVPDEEEEKDKGSPYISFNPPSHDWTNQPYTVTVTLHNIAGDTRNTTIGVSGCTNHSRCCPTCYHWWCSGYSCPGCKYIYPEEDDEEDLKKDGKSSGGTKVPKQGKWVCEIPNHIVYHSYYSGSSCCSRYSANICNGETCIYGSHSCRGSHNHYGAIGGVPMYVHPTDNMYLNGVGGYIITKSKGSSSASFTFIVNQSSQNAYNSWNASATFELKAFGDSDLVYPLSSYSNPYNSGTLKVDSYPVTSYTGSSGIYKFDNIKPTIEYSQSGAYGSNYTNSDVNYTININDTLSGIKYESSYVTVTPSKQVSGVTSRNYSFAGPSLSGTLDHTGEYTIYIHVEDIAGNINEEIRNVNVDKMAPVIKVALDSAGTIKNTNSQNRFEQTDNQNNIAGFYVQVTDKSGGIASSGLKAVRYKYVSKNNIASGTSCKTQGNELIDAEVNCNLYRYLPIPDDLKRKGGEICLIIYAEDNVGNSAFTTTDICTPSMFYDSPMNIITTTDGANAFVGIKGTWNVSNDIIVRRISTPMVFINRANVTNATSNALTVIKVNEKNWGDVITEERSVTSSNFAVSRNKLNDTIGLGYRIDFKYSMIGYGTNLNDYNVVTFTPYGLKNDNPVKLDIYTKNPDESYTKAQSDSKYYTMKYIRSSSNTSSSITITDIKLNQAAFCVRNSNEVDMYFNYCIPANAKFKISGTNTDYAGKDVLINVNITSHKGFDTSNTCVYSLENDNKITWGSNKETFYGSSRIIPSLNNGKLATFWYDAQRTALYDINGGRS